MGIGCFARRSRMLFTGDKHAPGTGSGRRCHDLHHCRPKSVSRKRIGTDQSGGRIQASSIFSSFLSAFVGIFRLAWFRSGRLCRTIQYDSVCRHRFRGCQNSFTMRRKMDCRTSDGHFVGSFTDFDTGLFLGYVRTFEHRIDGNRIPYVGTISINGTA
ncbi:MAG: hypothetical protein BWY58_01274 [Chloroflexi bacterium ADurb.Bin344]|nr:MAG: hypothetical protein BWY58_01274 [Chloroflexi bacterium ADurb.Bin344]